MKKPPLAISISALTVSICLLTTAVVRAQRPTFPSLVEPTSPAASYGTSLQPPPPTFDPYALPSGTPPPMASTMPPALDATPGAYSPYGSGPVYGGTPSAVYPEGPPVYSGDVYGTISNGWNQTMRFMQEIHVDETWLARGGGQSAMGVNTINTWAAFAIPFYYNANPLLVTPGFQLSLWDGPIAFGTEPATLPGSTYGAYLDFAWNPRINNWLAAELEVSPGVYTDFQHFTSQSIRILGKGMGVITLSDTLQFKVGVWYIDRNLIKLLPAGGLVWTPNPDSRYEITFPAPKLAHRCRTIGNHNTWAYVRGEYGGGAWTVQRPPGGVQTQTINDNFDYNDIRVAFGVDVLPETATGLRGYLEIGYVFNRQLIFRSGDPSQFNLTDTLLVGGGLSY